MIKRICDQARIYRLEIIAIIKITAVILGMIVFILIWAEFISK
jgi:hypothetical protein